MNDVRTYRVNGKRYDVPLADAERFDAFIRGSWSPQMPTTMQADRGTVKVSASLRSLSFTHELSAWAERHWGGLEVAALAGKGSN